MLHLRADQNFSHHPWHLWHICLHSHQMLDKSSIIFAFHTQQFSERCITLSFLQCKPTHPSDDTHLSSVLHYLMLHFHRPRLADTCQTTAVVSCTLRLIVDLQYFNRLFLIKAFRNKWKRCHSVHVLKTTGRDCISCNCRCIILHAAAFLAISVTVISATITTTTTTMVIKIIYLAFNFYI